MKFKRFKLWVLEHKKPILISAAVLVVVLVGLWFLGIFSSETVERTNSQETVQAAEEEPEIFYSPLTGAEVSKADTTRPVTGVIIENSPDARPQSGLFESDLIFEAIAEGGITRFAVFYQEGNPELVGPVRSARPYFNDWLMTYDASIAHVGGSQEALDEIQSLGIKDLDQFVNSQYYWRATDRYAPHNVYTNFENLDAANKSKGFNNSEFESLPRKDGKPAATPSAKQVTIDVSSFLYQVDYTYDKATNSYARFMGGQPHVDREKGQIKPDVAVVLKVPNGPVGGFRYAYQLVGSGDAVIFQNGNATEVKWSRADRSSQFEVTTAAGKEVKLNRGQTWFTAIDPSRNVTWTP